VFTVRSPEEVGRPVPYWSAATVAELGTVEPWAGSEEEAVAALDDLLRDAVRLRMVADVPLGAFLSGGIDSSTVVALMQAQSSRPVKTFTVGFEERDYDEADHARAVARHLGTEHTELTVTSAEARAVIPRLPDIYDEPFADSSQIPTFLVSQLARRHVSVSLSGDGGDELFGGYDHYRKMQRLWGKVRWLPRMVRRGVRRAILGAGLPTCASWGGGRLANLDLFRARLRRTADLLAAANPDEAYEAVASHWTGARGLVIGYDDGNPGLSRTARAPNLPTFLQRMMYVDSVTYLPDVILTKLDRASMAVSLEARVPILDHRVVEFAWRLPCSLRLRNGQGKWALRQVLYRYVPQGLVERPKKGFGVPVGLWLRGPLRDWAEALLDESRLRREGYLNPAPIRAKWAEHLSGQLNWELYLWDVLMFQAWLDRWSH
jgi:asparagine synthase (glutamine-hydrolysing)